METSDWQAWYNRMPGAGDPRLHVSGVCHLRSASTRVRLEPGNEGTVDDPAVAVLRLVVEEGDVGVDLIEDRPVYWDGFLGADVERVVVRVPDAEPVRIDVFEATVAPAGVPAMGAAAVEPAELVPANFYEFSGGDLGGTITLSGIDGSEHVTLHYRGREIDVTKVADPWGFRLTGELQIGADAGAILIEVRVPVVHLTGRADRFDALGVVVSKRSSIGGTSILRGALEVYEAIPLHGGAMVIQT